MATSPTSFKTTGTELPLIISVCRGASPETTLEIIQLCPTKPPKIGGSLIQPPLPASDSVRYKTPKNPVRSQVLQSNPSLSPIPAAAAFGCCGLELTGATPTPDQTFSGSPCYDSPAILKIENCNFRYLRTNPICSSRSMNVRTLERGQFHLSDSSSMLEQNSPLSRLGI